MYRKRFDLDVTPDPRAASLRWLTLFALVGYPVGAALEWGYASVGLSDDVIGTSLRFGAMIAAVVVLISRLQQIAGGQRKKLDEFELSHRLAALEKAYPALSIAVVFSFLYLGLATKQGWWVPSTMRHWQVIAFYFMLLAAMLPTTVLVWSRASDTLEIADPEAE
nr:hypothetical protein [uncultured Sphingomonas sp.]